MRQPRCVARNLGAALTRLITTRTFPAYAAAALTVALLGVSMTSLYVPRAFPGGAGDATGEDVASTPDPGGMGSVLARVQVRLEADLDVLRRFRPGYAFWKHIYTIPDGHVAYGSARDGRLLVAFPRTGDWKSQAAWEDPPGPGLLDRRPLPDNPVQRRTVVAELLETAVGPVLHNSTRGRFYQPNAERYGDFVHDWKAIYERFGVPPELGLAQALLESGFDGSRRSEAGAAGLCQWLPFNWRRLQRHSEAFIEVNNSTTQAAYCAAYLSVLATAYDSFIPALSEHHAGGTNVGRVLVNGERLGGRDAREQYLLGSELARGLRALPGARYRSLVRSYGPRSARYAEMIFGNMVNVGNLADTVSPTPIHATRVSRAVPIEEVMRRTGLGRDEVRRFNPALVGHVPAGAHLYAPEPLPELGEEVSFWRRSADEEYVELLDEFTREAGFLEPGNEEAAARRFEEFEVRFRELSAPEAQVMAAALAYATEEWALPVRKEILRDFRTNPRLDDLLRQGLAERGDWPPRQPPLTTAYGSNGGIAWPPAD